MAISRIYLHRLNKDGSYRSICPTCFLTVSQAETEMGLTDSEMFHVCNAKLLSDRARYKQKRLPPLHLAKSSSEVLG